jgi:hypothetical protein
MLLKHRAPRIEARPADTAAGFQHIDENSIAVLRWLNESRVDYVLVGSVAEAVRGRAGATGPVAIVPAPYRRNAERLARALWKAHARLRLEHGVDPERDTVPVKLTAQKLASGQRWTVRCGRHELDIEGHPDGGAHYQELLYEAARFEVAAGVAVEVASPEDIERYAEIRRTGLIPEITISRTPRADQEAS